VALFFSGQGIGNDEPVITVAHPSENIYNPISQNAGRAKWPPSFDAI
jgi:hypothetical protein